MHDQRPGRQLSHICSIESERHLGTAIVRLHGEFDLSGEARLQDEVGALLDSEVGTFVLDLRGLTFMDSTGLRVLVSLHRLAAQDGFDFAVLCEDGNVRRVLCETGLDGMLPIVDPSDAVPA